MILIEFDSLIYSLQKYGGASVYWKNIVDRVRLDARFIVFEVLTSAKSRAIPVFSKSDIFHSSHFRTTFCSSARTVTTVHDLTYELGMLGGGIKAKLNILERKKSYFDADAIICISENTKKDLLEIYPALINRCPIYTIHHGFVAPDFKNQILPPQLDGVDYLLYVGGRNGYKNFELALRGFIDSGVWRDGVKLVCTGSDFNEQELELLRQLGISNSIISVGLVTQAVLFRLYSNAHCLLYTSKYEGFGLPLIEAMSVGCPVIGAAASCIPEIVGNAGFLVNANSSEQVAQAILSLQERVIRDEIIQIGFARSSEFSWDISASKHMDVYASLK